MTAGSSVLGRLNTATRNRARVTLCLDASLQAQWDALSQRLPQAEAEDEAAAAAAERAASLETDRAAAFPRPAVTAVVEEMEALREQMAASQVTFAFEGLDWTARVAMLAQYPPDRSNFLDRANGYDYAGFTLALIRGTCVEVTDAAGDTATDIPDATWDHLLGTPTTVTTDETGAQVEVPAKPGALNANAVDRLRGTAWEVTEGDATVPPSARSLLETQDSGASSTSPGPGAYPLDGSTAGNPPGSSTSSDTPPGTPSMEG